MLIVGIVLAAVVMFGSLRMRRGRAVDRTASRGSRAASAGMAMLGVGVLSRRARGQGQ